MQLDFSEPTYIIRRGGAPITMKRRGRRLKTVPNEGFVAKRPQEESSSEREQTDNLGELCDFTPRRLQVYLVV